MHPKQPSTQLKMFSWVIVIGALWIMALITLMLFQFKSPIFEKDKTLAILELVENNVTLNEPISPLPVITTLDVNKIALGRQLFEDPILSENNSLSCNSCHNLQQGGVDHLLVSKGIGVANDRNTPTIYNVGFNFRQFWDGREITLEDELFAHTNKTNEMGLSMVQIAQKLQSNVLYQEQFKNVYGSDIISENTVVDAITTFERALVTPAPIDDWLRGNKKALTDKQKKGYQLFKSYGCVSCHQGVNVGGNMFEKLGIFQNILDEEKTHRDLGRFNITQQEENKLEFRVPSLRNVALTAPYLHDGSVNTLREAIMLMSQSQLGISLQASDVDAIENFLESLTGQTPQALLQ